MEETPSIIVMSLKSLELHLSYMPNVSDLSSKIILIIYWLTTQLGPSAILLKVEICKLPDFKMDLLPTQQSHFILSILQPNNPLPSHSSLSAMSPQYSRKCSPHFKDTQTPV